MQKRKRFTKLSQMPANDSTGIDSQAASNDILKVSDDVWLVEQVCSEE